MTYVSLLSQYPLSSQITPKRHIHFIGVGGIGMSALALVLAKRGFSISGSDQKAKSSFQHLLPKQIEIFENQTATNIQRIIRSKKLSPLVVISTAIKKNNPELVAATLAKLDIWHRSELLAALIKQQPSIAVAGSHGKTTTSTMITTLLATTKQDPTAVVGGIVPYYKSNAYAGKGKYLVAEADESDGSLIKFEAEIGLINNIELDHTDHYENLDALIETMKTFGSQCKILLANYDCSTVRDNINASIWWSVNTYKEVDYAALAIESNGQFTIANIYEKGALLGQVRLSIPGKHNLSNLIAAIATCRIAGIEFSELKNVIQKIESPSRRFEYKGLWEGRQVVDDYAHHPSEVEATLTMARLMIESNKSCLPRIPQRLVVVFQPHRYSRTEKFIKDFAHILGKADYILLAPVYAAGEKPINNINSKSLEKYCKRYHPSTPVIAGESLEEVTNMIKKFTKKGDLILTMGAGNINSIWDRLKNKQWTKANAAA